MPKNNMTLRIGGEAGQGVESGAMGLAKTLARGGLHVYGLKRLYVADPWWLQFHAHPR